jgi:hypothetical protein
MPDLCKMCETNALAPADGGPICEVCRDELGIIPMPPPRRRPAPCRRCDSMRFVRVIPRESPNIAAGRGLLEMDICSQCGAVEWYCHDPESIPIGPEYMSDIVDYSASEPYR